MLRCVWLLFAVLVAGCANSARLGVDGAQGELDRIVGDLCTREVVLLGEDRGHGGGHTLEVKATIADRLMRECGFTRLAFEGQFYEFVAFNRDLAQGRATRRQLADAIGGLWSDSAQMQPVLDNLFDQAMTGGLQIVGIDPQVGSASGHYAFHELPGALAGVLAEPQKGICKTEIERHNNWRYDKANPFDDAAKQRLQECAVAIEEQTKGASAEVAAMAKAYALYARYVGMPGGVDSQNLRDEGMYELLTWWRAQDTAPRKTLVWCSTVHAGKTTGASGRIPMGRHLHEEIGRRMAAIGFTAVGGQFGRPGSSKDLPPPTPDMLEAKAAPVGGEGLRYLGNHELVRLGKAPARILGYSKPETADWAAFLDGVVVLGEEEPLRPLSP